MVKYHVNFNLLIECNYSKMESLCLCFPVAEQELIIENFPIRKTKSWNRITSDIRAGTPGIHFSGMGHHVRR